MSELITFWKLIKENKIEIPIIQRDYAQGREEDKVNTIRKEFVKDLISALEEDGKSLHLGFVYGKIDGKDKHAERERNKRAIENILNAVEGYAQQLDMRIQTDISAITIDGNAQKNLPTFNPLDGQQRLTTLYLMHWYLAVMSEEIQETTLQTLHNFTYKTRKSSFEFCDAICQIENVRGLSVIEGKLSQAIENKKWFRKIWLKDSTVKGMLVMLDAMHSELFPKKNKSQLLQQLIDENSAVVNFDFLDLNELNQTDELYVKMNARGKQLTEFEHFKAWLQNYISTKRFKTGVDEGSKVLLQDLIKERDWKRKIDRTWLDLFWRNKEGGVFSVDKIVFHAFKQIALFDFIASSDKNDVTLSFSRKISDNSFIPFSLFEEHDFFNQNTLNFLFAALEALSEEESIKKYNTWLADITNDSFFGKKLDLATLLLKSDKNLDRDESVYYYSFLLYLTSVGNKASEDHFKDWMRFTRNIVFNTYIQNPENFFDAIKAIYSLSPQINTITTYLKSPTFQIAFFGDAVKQEILKSQLVDVNADWQNPIVEFENHHYFKGDIRFILELSKEDEEYNLQKFINYGNAVSLLFDDSIRNDPQNLLHRALLTFGDYLPQVGPNYLFPLSNRDSLRARRDNWQRVFKHDKNDNRLIILKELCDFVLNDLSDIKNKLVEVIESYIEKDWRWYFIKNSKVIGYCTQGFIRWEDEENILLMKTSRIYGTHAELRSYYHYCENIKDDIEPHPFSEIIYYSNNMGKYDYPVVRFKNWKFKGKKYRLEMTFSKEGFYLLQFRNQEPNIKLNNKLESKLSNMSWSISDNKYIAKYEVPNETNVILELKHTINELNLL